MNVHATSPAQNTGWQREGAQIELDSAGFDARALIGTFLRRLPIIIGLPFVAMAISMAIFAVLPSRYTASITILIDPKAQNKLGPDVDASWTMIDGNRINSIVSLMQSTSLLERVAKTANLTADPEFSPAQPTPSLRSRIMSFIPFLGGSSEEVVRPDEAAARLRITADRIRAATVIARENFSYVIKVDVSARDPIKAAKIANTIGDQYLNDQLEARYDAAKRASNWLAERLAELRAELQQSEEVVAQARQQYGLAETDRGATVVQAQVTELNSQLSVAQGEMAQKQAKFEQARRIQQSGGNIEALPEVVASTVIGTLRGQQSDASRRVADFSQRYGPKHPEVLRAEEERRAIDRQISNEVGRIIANIRNDYDTVQKRVQTLQEQMSKLTGVGGAQNAEGLIKVREAQRVADANRQLYDSFLNRFKEMEQKQTLQELESRIISSAQAPGAPSFPRLLPFLLVSAGLGLLLGLGAAFLLEQMETTFATPSQAERFLKLPCLAMVPLLKQSELLHDGRMLSVVDYVRAKQFSRFAETLRSIRVGLRMTNIDKPARVVQLTSSVPSEGKSTLAAALAISSAQAGMKTILIDSDFRHPSASKLFSLQNDNGLVDLLIGSASWQDIAAGISGLPLTVVPAGQGAKSPPDLMNSTRMRDLLRMAGEHFEMVIVDSPPTQAVSDAVVISSLVDSTIFVIEWRQTSREMVASSVNQIHMSKGRVAGVILNKADFTRLQAYGYGYGYGYYGYGAGYGKYGKYYRSTSKYYST